MAAGGPVQELCKEASCSICLDFFRDPVMIPECGHSFCRACLTWSWGESEGAETSCPQCRGPAQEGNLRPNQQLANFVEITQKLNPLEGRGQKRRRGICEKHQEPQKFICQEDDAPLCLVCSRSQEHKDHTVIPLEEAVEENRATMSARKERFCEKHQEPLKLFCKDDKALICVVCDRSKEHRNHETLPLEEASQEYKDHFCSCLEGLKKERERIVACKADVEKESQDLLKQATGEKQETVAKFKQLHSFLEEQEKLLLAQIEEVEKEVARNRDQHLTELSEALSSLESLIWEMEEKCQQPASELLWDARSTLQRCEEKKEFENPVAFPLALKSHIWDFSDLNLFLESIKKQHKDILDSGLQLQKANVTLDPDTAHPILILSEDWKSMRDGGKAQSLPNNPERFDSYPVVLGCEGFTAGRHFWEVVVGSEGEWMLGVARKSVKRKGKFTLSPEEGIWAVGKWGGHCRAAIKGHNLPLTLRGELKRIRVCLNYDGGRVAFFDADRAALMYEFSGASFSGETLVPYFWVYKKGHLKLSS
ncbi:E3 ubiquitin-protein ligase TRIM7-like [Sphaerodactylus townsendi]|uniref:E3 ubiquitin-protein ligase TRIM7-like n=1 Tax=Sphaerodactylus townsendi TaxID=933632 RepID=UPI0020264FAF|nr:E3 ubiquitin-protein ligase TRIM7-like [Sphaerodactylus townsendi]